MQWKQLRLGLILVVVFGGLWYLYPSLRISDYGKSWPLKGSLTQSELDKIAKDPLSTSVEKAELTALGLTKEEFDSYQDSSFRLGLDLQGGVHVVLEVDKSGLPENEAKDVVERAKQVIDNRVNEFGVTEPIIQREGEDRIIVELPGLKDINRALALINQTAQLEFKLLREEVEFAPLVDRIEALVSVRDTTGADSGSVALTVDAQPTSLRSLGDVNGQEFTVPAVNLMRVEEILARPDVKAIIPSGTELRAGVDRTLSNGLKVRTYYYMNSAVELTGAVLSDAFPQSGSGASIGSIGIAAVGFKTTDDGARIFAQVTGNNIGKRLAIVLDGRVFSAPNIQGRIPNGSGEITGINSLEEAKDLAIVLRAGALPAPMRIISKQVVGPSLGQDAINSGKLSSIAGLVAVVVFMFFYYRTSGLLANLGLVINLVLLLAVMAAFQATLTLPGIAGIILTMGMAVDSNILIFERIKEELRSGNRTVRQSIDVGYNTALRTIVDSNITTLITAYALYEFGTGPIKGFALTLGFGILISMFTAIFFTRALFDSLTDRWHVEKLSIGTFNLFGNSKFQFMKFAKTAFIITWAIIAAGVVAMIMNGGFKWGVDFQGGSLLEIRFDPPVEVQSIRDALTRVTIDGKTVDLGNSEIKEFGDPGVILIRSASEEHDKSTLGAAVKTILKQRFPDNLKGDELSWLNQEVSVEPKIGTELATDAASAIGWSIIGIMLYIGIRFRHVGGSRFGVGIIVALVHDVFIVLGMLALFGTDIDMGVVAAVLTVVGYSTNDTVVVFDRIREVVGRHRQESFSSIVDRSINETLNRTLTTSVTVLLVIILLLVGSESTNFGFGLALTIGVITGTYSSIFIASPIVVWWQNWINVRREAARIAQKNRPTNPGRPDRNVTKETTG